MPARDGFQLTSGDIHILTLLYAYRFLNIDHLIALTGRRHQMIHRRLLKLIERRYISRIVFSTFPKQKYLYALGSAACPLLVEQGIAPKEFVDVRLRHNELKELFLKHTLMIIEAHVALTRHTRDTHLKLVAWKQGQELFDRVSMREQGSVIRLPVRPDAFFTLEDTSRPAGRNRLHFMLEADRSTTSHERFANKLKAYWEYFTQGLHTKKYNIKSFVVLTLTLTKDRAANLQQLAERVIPRPARKYYLFTTLHNFSTLPFENVYSIPHEAQLCSLLPEAPHTTL